MQYSQAVAEALRRDGLARHGAREDDGEGGAAVAGLLPDALGAGLHAASVAADGTEVAVIVFEAQEVNGLRSGRNDEASDGCTPTHCSRRPGASKVCWSPPPSLSVPQGAPAWSRKWIRPE